MCCLIVYFLISCISIIYSFHIFLYSYYSSIHIISYIHIYSYFLSNLYSSIQFGTARNPVPNISNIQSQNLGTKSQGLFRPRKQPMPLHGFLFQVGKIPYLVEFDETPKFWYPRVARNVWINFVSGPTNSNRHNAVNLRKYRNLGFSELLT